MEMPLSEKCFVMLISKLNDARKMNVNVENLQSSVIAYIRVFPHHLRHIPEGNFYQRLISYVFSLETLFPHYYLFAAFW
jgi:hypothetical protein